MPLLFNAPNPSGKTTSVVGFYAALLTTLLTAITFGFAITAVPISGANCPGDCIEYPYLDTLSQFPKDYLWMYLAVLQILAYMILVVAIHTSIRKNKRIFSHIALSFTLISAIILVSDYFVQFTVVPISLRYGETRGIPLLTQYNPHGIFIALEEAGYLMMSLSFLFLAPVFSREMRKEKAIRWIFLISVLLVLLALVIISIQYGLDRQDRFEVIVISLNWLVLLVNGGLLSLGFRKQINAAQDGEQ